MPGRRRSKGCTWTGPREGRWWPERRVAVVAALPDVVVSLLLLPVPLGGGGGRWCKSRCYRLRRRCLFPAGVQRRGVLHLGRVGEALLFLQEIGSGALEGRRSRQQVQVGDGVAEVAAKAARGVGQHGPVADGRTNGAEIVGEGLEAAAVLRDRHVTLVQRVKLLEVEDLPL